MEKMPSKYFPFLFSFHFSSFFICSFNLPFPTLFSIIIVIWSPLPVGISVPIFQIRTCT